MSDLQMNQLRAEVAHWTLAVESLGDLEAIASPVAWAALERYLQQRVRTRLADVVTALRLDSDRVASMFDAGRSVHDIRPALLRLRQRYLRAETLLDFFGDAVNSRTNPRLTELLQGYDIIASESIARTLSPLGMDGPPVLVYHDKGLGASILRAGIRLWDESHPSPVAAIKLTRHNLTFPTALLHETGHQALALAGYNDELRRRLYQSLEPRSRRVASLVSAWASELGADVHAVHHAGLAPVFALANVVDGTSQQVFAFRPGDPHPPPFVRIAFNVGLLRGWFGAGPWDELAATWRDRHPIDNAGELAGVTSHVIAAIPMIVEQASASPMQSFRGKSFGDLVDPQRVSPASLQALAAEAGGTLLTSTYLQRRDPVRILALLATRGVLDAALAAQHREALTAWVRALGRTSSRPVEAVA